MDKSWIWKKKSTEKTMITEDEFQANLANKMELEKNLKISDDKLSAALAEINAKDEIAKKQTNIAREAIQGWEKAETEVLALKQELDKATQQRAADEERLNGADAALKECMLQLRFVREEQEKRINDAVTKTSTEYEKIRIDLEEKLTEANRRLTKLGIENTQLNKTLSEKEKIINELHAVSAQVDYDLRAVVSTLDSAQRENASLSYEVQMLEKELEIRNEEREFNRRTSEAAHKQYLGNVKKIAKLETEAQRLRLLVQKRLPGPADVVKMKNAVNVLGKESAEGNRRRSNPFPVASTDFVVDDASSKNITFLTEQVCALEEENKLLKEFLNQKTNELTKSQMSDMGSDEKVSMAESWTPSGYTVGASDIGLMDDFVEMEKLALVSVEKPFVNSTLVQENHSHWLDNILKVVADHAKIMQQSSSDMLEDIKVALAGKDTCNFQVPIDKKDSNAYICDESMNKSIQKLVELVEGVRLSEKDDNLSLNKTSETPTGYTVHVFQWKTSELRGVLEAFLQSCNKMVDGKAGVEDFVKELTSAMEWIVNHCFSLQDVSSMKDDIKQQFNWDETRSESEVEGGTHGRLSEADKLDFPKDQSPGWPMANIRNKIFHLEPNVREEIRKLKDDVANLESTNKDLEVKLQSESAKCASLLIQLQESGKGMMEALNEQKENQTEEEDIVEKDIDKHPIETINECNEAHQEPISIKEQESMAENDLKGCDLDHDETILTSEHEITAASEKLAECQETIINIGKQLKAMTSLPVNMSSSNSCEITVLPKGNEPNNERISLLDKMITEDAAGAPRSQKPKGVARTLTSPAILDGNSNPVMTSPRMFVSVDGVKDEKDEEALINFLSVVPNKKKSSGGGILRRLFGKKKKN